MEEITFTQTRPATACIQYVGARRQQQWENEYNALLKIPEKNRAHIELYADYCMIIRCNAAARFDYKYLMNDDAEYFTGYPGSKF